MDRLLTESKYLFDTLLDNTQRKGIVEFLNNLSLEKEKYRTDILWKIDKGIGGVGGYCLPENPTINPFPAGTERKLFRPLQYARSEIDISDIRFHSRYVIHNSGMHLEAVLRYFFEETKLLGKFYQNKSTLGKLAAKLEEANILGKSPIDALYKFIVLYNMAKHEVNTFDERERLFSPGDAVISYFTARIIGQEVLIKMDYQSSLKEYGIYKN